MKGPVVSLLPVRNGEADLPGHLESVARYADAVVALDDGSTDATREILDAHPLVRTVLSNPRRDSYVGWDDSGNRNRLLEAAQALEPSWVMSLDADELISADDASALRAFLEDGADPDDAYLFPVHRMIGNLGHHDGSVLWVGRMFSPRPGQRFPTDRLHFVPLPSELPRDRWRRTTFRIQHCGAITAEHRRARFAKYGEADPGRRWQASYDHLLDAPERMLAWTPRGRLLPPLAHQPVVDDTPLPAADAPAISVVIISYNDEKTIARSVAAAVAQEMDEPFEVIVVVSGTDRTAEVVRSRFPEVTLVELEGVALPGRARNAGLAVARGRYVAFPGSHVEIAPGSLAPRLAAHRRGWPLVTDSMRNGTLTCAGWAAYFLDNAAVLPARPSYEFDTAPPRCSYPRDLLVDFGGFPNDVRTAEDTVVNDALFNRGYGAFRDQSIVTTHYNPCPTVGRLVVHHFGRGRGKGRLLASDLATGAKNRSQVRRSLVRWVPGRLRWTHQQVSQFGGPLRGVYRRTLPLIVVGAVAAWVGGAYELARSGALGRLPLLRRRTEPRPAALEA